MPSRTPGGPHLIFVLQAWIWNAPLSGILQPHLALPDLQPPSALSGWPVAAKHEVRCLVSLLKPERQQLACSSISRASTVDLLALKACWASLMMYRCSSTACPQPLPSFMICLYSCSTRCLDPALGDMVRQAASWGCLTATPGQMLPTAESETAREVYSKASSQLQLSGSSVPSDGWPWWPQHPPTEKMEWSASTNCCG